LSTHNSEILEALPDSLHYAFDIRPSLHEPDPARERHVADHIKGIVLEPVTEVTGLARYGKSGIQLGDHHTDGLIDQRLVGQDTGHGVKIRDRPLHTAMQALVRRGEDPLYKLAFIVREIHRVEVRLIIF
jgi:hypothetical protein